MRIWVGSGEIKPNLADRLGGGGKIPNLMPVCMDLSNVVMLPKLGHCAQLGPVMWELMWVRWPWLALMVMSVASERY